MKKQNPASTIMTVLATELKSMRLLHVKIHDAILTDSVRYFSIKHLAKPGQYDEYVVMWNNDAIEITQRVSSLFRGFKSTRYDVMCRVFPSDPDSIVRILDFFRGLDARSKHN